MSDEDKDNKTEDPSQKKLDEAIEKGNVPFSRELTHFFMMLMLAMTVAVFAPAMLWNARVMLAPFIIDADRLATDTLGISLLLRELAFGSMGVLALPFIATIIAALAGSFLQNGFILSGQPMMPQLERISPLAGLGRLFSMRSVVEFLKSLIKLGVVGYIAFMTVYPKLAGIEQLPNGTAEGLLVFIAMLAKHMTISVAIAMFFIALLDIFYQRFQYIKSLRMSKQELKDEYKQSEGDPMIKMRLRRLRQERAQNRMMSSVPKADVVITNPTHFAIALQYDSGKMKAPMVLAKGQDLIALKIREIAIQNNIPIVENKPLARALFDAAEIDKEIPTAHYEAVAKIISYVYQLKGKKFKR